MEVTRRKFFFSFAGLCAGITMLPEILATPFQKKLILPGTSPDMDGVNIGIVTKDLGLDKLEIRTFGYRKHGSHIIIRTPERVVVVEGYNPAVYEYLKPVNGMGQLAYISPDHTGKMKASPGTREWAFRTEMAMEEITPAPPGSLRRGFPRTRGEMPWITREYVRNAKA